MSTVVFLLVVTAIGGALRGYMEFDQSVGAALIGAVLVPLFCFLPLAAGLIMIEIYDVLASAGVSKGWGVALSIVVFYGTLEILIGGWR